MTATMVSTDVGAAVQSHQSKSICLFLDRLPLELRQAVYRFLLLTHHNKIERETKSAEVSLSIQNHD